MISDKWVMASKTILTALGGILLVMLPMAYEGLRTGQLVLPLWLQGALPWITMILFAMVIYFRKGATQSLTMKRTGKDKNDLDSLISPETKG